MKKYTILITLASLAAIVSCEKEPGKEDFGKKDLTIRASIAATRVAATSESITWTAGDAILVTCDGETYNFATTQSGTNVDFTSSDGLTQGMVGINPLTAFYGCTQFGAFTIPQNQIISGDASQTRLPMYAYTTAAPQKGEVAMVFTPAASVLEVTISAVDATVNKVELVPLDETAVTGTVAGPGTVNAVTGKVAATGNLKSVSATFQGGASAKNGLVFRMPVGWFSVTGGMKLILTYNETNTYEELIWSEEDFKSYEGSGDSKSYKYIKTTIEMILGARDYYVAPDARAASKGIRPEDPATLDYALSSADAGSVIHLAEGTYKPERLLLGDETGDEKHKTFEISRGLTLTGEGPDKTILDADAAYHAVCITALPEEKVTIKNLAIKSADNSTALSDASVKSTVNGNSYADDYGTGLYAIGSDITLENVLISGNNGTNGTGAYLRKVKAELKNVEISGNKSSGNGCGLWVSGSTVTMDGCNISSNNGGGVAAGLYIYAAKEESATVTVSNCVLENNVTTNNNSGLYVRGADASANVSATFTNCIIRKNQGNMGGGFGTIYATVLFDGCQVLENTGSGNGGNYIQGGSTVTAKDCIFRGNTAGGVAGAIYEYTNADAVVLNIIGCEFSENKSGLGTNAQRGGAVYARAGSGNGATLNVANSTFYGNWSGHFGSAIALNASATQPVTANIYSCTITGNTCGSANASRGGAIGVETDGITANIYNTVVSGNIWETTPSGADVYVAKSSAVLHKSIKGSAVYDADGTAVAAAPAFDPASMLSKKAQDGKTTVFSLVGSDNPAKTYGYDVAGLKALGATVDGTVLEKDQWGNARSANVMGAYVE